jgi:hypothetical protein
MKFGMAAAAFAAALGLCAPAAAGPRTIDDCESIKDPSAYNLCLASFGPVRGQHGATYPGVATEGDKGGDKAASQGANMGAEAAPASRSRHGRHGHWRGRIGGYHARGARSSNGRVRMEFSPAQ